MNYREKIHIYISNHKDEILYNLKELIKKPSVREKSEKDAPFGKNCANTLEYIEKLYFQNGFKPKSTNRADIYCPITTKAKKHRSFLAFRRCCRK